MYRSPVVSVLPAWLIDSIMSQSTIAIGFYTMYFGHVTNYTCMPNEYPHGFVLGDNRLSIFDNRWSISQHGFVYILSQHPGISPPTNQISESEYLAHGYHEGLQFSSRKFISQLENFKQVTSINGEHFYIYSYCSLECCRSQCKA